VNPAMSIVPTTVSALGGGLNRSTQHLLILVEEEVCDGGDVTALRICQMSKLGSAWTAVLMMQFLTYFRCFNQCQLSFMPFASSLHAAVAFSRATLSPLDSFAASAGVGMNAVPLTSTVAIMPADKADT
jgi:hypothetical protein